MADEPREIVKPTNVTPAEMGVAFEGPAIYANKILLTMNPHVGRLTFLELQPPEMAPHFRAAVTLGITELVALRDLLNKTLTDDNLEMVDLVAHDAATK